METILNPFRIRLTAFQPAGAGETPGFGNVLPIVKMLLASVFDRKKVNGPKRHRQLPVEIPQNGQEETFEVSIKFVRKGVHPCKSSKGSSPAWKKPVQPDNDQAGDSAL